MKPPKQEEIPMEGPGVSPIKDKKLDKLCDKFIEIRDGKAKLAEELGATETEILARMAELKIEVHRFGDQIAKIKTGKNHVKIKTVTADGDSTTEGDED